MKTTLEMTDLFTTRVVVVASPDHPLARERRISAARLAEFRCAGTSATHFALGTLLGLPDEENLAAATTNDYAALYPLLWCGDIVLATTSHSIQPEIEAGRAVILDLDWRLDVPFVAVTTRAASSAPILRRFVDFAREAAERIDPDGAKPGYSERL